jgi:hypothetical protein
MGSAAEATVPDDSTRRQLGLLGELEALLAALRVRAWLRGGWALDFHLGAVTRPHADIDLVTWARHRARLQRVLPAHGFALEREFPVQTDFTKGGHGVSVVFIARGEDGRVTTPGIPAWAWRPDALPLRTRTPAGQGAYAYAVEAAGGGRFFLKLLPPHDLGWAEPAHLDYYLPLARALAARGYLSLGSPQVARARPELPPPADSEPAARRRPALPSRADRVGPDRRQRIGLIDLIEAGLLTPPTELRLAAKGLNTRGVVTPDGQVEVDGRRFTSLSAAAVAVTGWPAAAGWREWRCQDPRTGAWVRLDDIRQRLAGPRETARQAG